MKIDTHTTAKTFKALSEPIRLRILSLLQTDTLCVMDIVSILGLPQPTISRHLSYLQKAGLIRSEKKGLWHFYASAKDSPSASLLKTFFKTTASCVEFERDQKKAAHLRRQGGCCPKSER